MWTLKASNNDKPKNGHIVNTILWLLVIIFGFIPYNGYVRKIGLIQPKIIIPKRG